MSAAVFDVGFAVSAHFLVVEADDGQSSLLGEGHQQRVLGGHETHHEAHTLSSQT